MCGSGHGGLGASAWVALETESVLLQLIDFRERSSEKEDFGLFGGVLYNGEAGRVHEVEITGAWVENVAFWTGRRRESKEDNRLRQTRD